MAEQIAENKFDVAFTTLTGFAPLSWQRRLHDQWLAGDIKATVDLPTGMGKTMVMAIWLIARASNRSLSRRLVYVVDRRTVVDQATDLAENIQRNAKTMPGFEVPSISTLRGQFADNREWTRDLSKPAIIIGTVDMIGSRLLFSGYRSSYKARPLDAGLLGQDALLILDEAHLSAPFAKLTRSIEEINRVAPLPLRVVHMSATNATGDANRFKLEHPDLEGDRDKNSIVRRFEAEKRLCIREGVANANAEIAKKAVELAKEASRVIVFVRSPETVSKIAGAIRSDGDKKQKPFAKDVAVLTGTMRGLERDELLQKPELADQHERRVMQRFLDPVNRPDEGPAILISTSAGEVGFDLNADHLVCDAAPLDSIIQRLGRVNRRGDGAARVHLFAEAVKEKKKKEEKKENGTEQTFESASAEALKALAQLPKIPGEPAGNAYDASPKAFASLTKPDIALSPKPATVELTDILLDAWSMTTIVEPMPGRPPVAPWLRGISDNPPQTTIAWRAELDIEYFDQLDIEDLEEWLDAHCVLSHETLSVPTGLASEKLIERWQKLDQPTQKVVGGRSCIVDRAGLRLLKLTDLIHDLQQKRMDSIRDADLILPASFGGIERHEGLLRADAPSADSASPDVADAHDRYRQLRTFGDDSEDTRALLGTVPADLAGFARLTLDLPSDGDTQLQLISLVRKPERTEIGAQRQSLSSHVESVEKHAASIAAELGLNGSIRQALELAAKWHDHGKDREIWQSAVGRKTGEQPIGKSGGQMQRIPRGYRHEFGSLREFNDAHEGKNETDGFDLAMHLIATHHGRGRPHFPKGGFDPIASAKSQEVATDAIRRFARLQRKYGHWRLAWLENLLRCADAMASAEKEQPK